MSRFEYHPNLPTAAAYANKQFGNYYDLKDLIAEMRRKEKGRKLFYTGYLYFQPGFDHNFNDGTRGKPRDIPWWYDPAKKGCPKRCCIRTETTPAPMTPEDYANYLAKLAAEREDWAQFRKSQIEKYGSNLEFRHVNDLEMKLKEIGHDKLAKIWITDIGFWIIRN